MSDQQTPAIKLVSVTSKEAYEQEVSRLISLGYEPMGELKVESYKEQRFNGGGNMWEIVSGARYTREMRLKATCA